MYAKGAVLIFLQTPAGIRASPPPEHTLPQRDIFRKTGKYLFCIFAKILFSRFSGATRRSFSRVVFSRGTARDSGAFRKLFERFFRKIFETSKKQLTNLSKMVYLHSGERKSLFLRVLFNGRTSAFQAEHEGSIPFTRSNVPVAQLDRATAF